MTKIIEKRKQDELINIEFRTSLPDFANEYISNVININVIFIFFAYCPILTSNEFQSEKPKKNIFFQRNNQNRIYFYSKAYLFTNNIIGYIEEKFIS